MNNHFQCCPVCGHKLTYKNVRCFDCNYNKSLNRKMRKEIRTLYNNEIAHIPVELYISKYPIEHYEKISFQKYQTIERAFDVFVDEELSKLPTFNYKKYQMSLKKQEERNARKKYMEEHPEEFKPYNPLEHLPKCPTCGSTDIKKIGTLERGVSVAAFGLLSSKIGKTMSCNKCGYKW